MKVICKIRAFWDGEIIKPGQIVEIKGKDVPCWAKPLNGKAPEPKEDENGKAPEQKEDENGKAPEQNENNVPEDNKKDEVNPLIAQELAGKNESELNAILEELRTEALDKNITVDAENKTVIEQINELKIKLGKVNK